MRTDSVKMFKISDTYVGIPNMYTYVLENVHKLI